MANTVYDEHVQFYLSFVDAQIADPASVLSILLEQVLDIVWDDLAGKRVCDLACGEGYLSRSLARFEPAEVVGVDISSELIQIADARTSDPRVSFRVDDVQQLATLANDSFDVAVSQMAIMDIPDHQAMFGAASRILRPGGLFVLSMLHPCFEAPFRLPDEPPFVLDSNGQPVARLIRRYRSEGHWASGGTGVRGHMGAYHRTLSTILNGLVAAGFRLREIREPTLGDDGLAAELPVSLVIACSNSR